MFQDISNNPDHKLYRFLPEPNKCRFNLRLDQLSKISHSYLENEQTSLRIAFFIVIVYRQFYLVFLMVHIILSHLILNLFVKFYLIQLLGMGRTREKFSSFPAKKLQKCQTATGKENF